MVEWNRIFRLFRFSGILDQPREVHPKCRNEIPENVCSIRSPTRNFRNFWSNGKRPLLATKHFCNTHGFENWRISLAYSPGLAGEYSVKLFDNNSYFCSRAIGLNASRDLTCPRGIRAMFPIAESRISDYPRLTIEHGTETRLNWVISFHDIRINVRTNNFTLLATTIFKTISVKRSRT